MMLSRVRGGVALRSEYASLRRSLALAALLVIAACGGRTTSSDDDRADNGGGVSGSGASRGVAGQTEVSGGAAFALCKQSCPACSAATVPLMHAGACCPDCVPLAGCAAGQMRYQAARDTASHKFAFGCAADTDCVAVTLGSSCELACAWAAIVNTALESFDNYLETEAALDCAACTEFGVLCDAPMAVHCYAGQCAFSPP